MLISFLSWSCKFIGPAQDILKNGEKSRRSRREMKGMRQGRQEAKVAKEEIRCGPETRQFYCLHLGGLGVLASLARIIHRGDAEDAEKNELGHTYSEKHGND